jgi:carbonic anhydrase
MKRVEITYRYDDSDVPLRSRPADASGARRRLEDGNGAFAALLDGLAGADDTLQCVVPGDARDLGVGGGHRGAPSQRPFAAVLGCSDARVPVELIFGEGPNDLFVVRVAGNGLGSETLGSLRYAIDHLGASLKLITVLGHSGCGAVTAAVDVTLKPARYLPLAMMPSLRTIIDPLLIVVQASAKKLGDTHGRDVVLRPGYREALLEMAIVTNAALAAHSLERQLLAEGSRSIRVLYGVYLLETGRIWAPRLDSADWTGLAEPPEAAPAFAELGNAAAHSDRIVALLEGRPQQTVSHRPAQVHPMSSLPESPR